MTALPFWAPLALLGYEPWMIFTMQSVSLIYRFGLHTERIHRFPKPIEFLFNAPLTKSIDTHNPVRVAFQECASVWRDVRHAHGLHDKLGHLFGGPGRRPGDADRGLISTRARAAHEGPRVAAWDRPAGHDRADPAPTPGVAARWRRDICFSGGGRSGS